jgi:hypothetical protein
MSVMDRAGGAGTRPRWGMLGAALLTALAFVALAGPAQARWLRAESPKFIVYSDGDEMRLREQVEQLEVFDVMLRQWHSMPIDGLPPRKLEIYLVADKAGLQRMWPGVSDHIAGMYSPSIGDISAIAIRDAREASHKSKNAEDWSESTLFHEYTHHFMLQYFPAAFPTWLIEGYAEFFGTATVQGQTVEIGKFSSGRTYELTSTPWLPMEVVLGKRLDQIPDKQWGMFYAQSWLLTHYLKSDPVRAKQMLAYMVDIGKGADPVAAMQKATGQDIPTLTRNLHTYLMGGLKYGSYGRKGAVAPPITVTVLPPSADVMLLEAEHMRHGVARDQRETMLKTIRDKAAGLSGDRIADLALARAEMQLGDRKIASAIVDRRLAADPNDVEALELAARVRLADGDEENDYTKMRTRYQEAQPFLGRAFKLDPNRYQTLYTYVRSRQVLDKDYPSDNTLEAILAALEYAPQVAEIRFEATRAMMQRKRWREAAAIIAPLANDPHAAEAAVHARDLLQQIKDKAASEPEAPAKAG